MRSTEGNLWEATFVVEGVHLPEDKVVVSDHLRFERLSQEDADGIWLPARCLVQVTCMTDEVRSRAKRRLKHFLAIYSVMGKISI